MTAPLQGRCPGCKKTVRLPAEAAGKTIRCKQCGMVCEVRPTEQLLAKQVEAKRAAKPVAAKPAQPVAVAAPMSAPPSPSAAWEPAAPEAAWSAIADDDFGAPSAPTIKPRPRKRGGWITAIVVCVFLAGGLAAGAIALVLGVPIIKQKLKEREEAKNNDSTNGDLKIASPSDLNKPVPALGTATLPRRLLGISVNNYIFANPTSYGHDSRNFIKRDFGQTLEKMANRFRIPTDQVFEVSDASPGGKRQPPLKPIFERTLTKFCETSRPQDRVIVMLCAHTVEIDKKPYVVPLEGDLDDAKTLVPLDWIMQQLDKCPAQQKVFIVDFNRFDKARGRERPTGGKLSESAEAMLKNPPAGVQVWSASSAGQYSYEFDDYYDFNGQGIKGGAFLSLFSVAFLQGAGLKGIQDAKDPLPIESFAKKVNADMEALSSELPEPDDEAEAAPADEKKDDKAEKKVDKKAMPDDKKAKKPAAGKHKPLQTPFLAGQMKGDPVAHDPKAPPAEMFKVPTPQDVFVKGVVPRADVKKMLDIFALPPLKQTRISDSSLRVDQILPFTVEAMKDYRSDVPLDAIKKNADKYPLRIAVLDVIDELRKLNSGDISLPTELTEADRSDASKGNLAKLQREPARLMQKLSELEEKLGKAAEGRGEEKSKFWLATLDYLIAQLKARYVYVHEYTSVIGQVRKDVIPDLDKSKGQTKWRLGSSERLASGNDIRDMSKDARKIYAKLAKDHPGTPWEVLAKREKFTALGLTWEPFGEATREQKDAN